MIAALCFTFSASVPASAQHMLRAPQQQQPADVADEDLEKFAAALPQIQAIQKKAEGQIVAKLQEVGMEVQRYNEIAQAQQNPQVQVELTAAEEQQLEEISLTMTEVQKKVEGEVIAAVEEQGLSMEEYREIFMAIQTSPELQEKLRTMMEG